MTIQKAQTSEVEEIRDLLSITWNDAYSHLYTPEAISTVRSKWHRTDLISEQISHPRILFLTAKDGPKIIAMCNTDIFKDSRVNIQRLHVLPSYQRQGIGSKLLKKVFSSFPKIKRFDLEVEKQNKKAISFYKKEGFYKAGEKTLTISGVQMPCFIMEKVL